MCIVETCERDLYAKGMCKLHYQRTIRRGSPERLGMELNAVCPGCGNPFQWRSAGGGRPPKYCSTLCYDRWYRATYPERRRAWARDWYAGNSTKAKAGVRDYQKRNRPKVNALKAARKRRVRQATPPWADLAAIQAIYLGCPPGHEVDHVIPLKGKTVSGLHVPGNLQYLPMPENRRKGAQFQLAH